MHAVGRGHRVRAFYLSTHFRNRDSNMKSIRLATAPLVAAVIVSLSGCGEKLYPTTGKIMVDGKPVNEGTITFHPAAGGRPATARIMKDGLFTLDYNKPGDGLPAGEYKVAIIADLWIAGKRSAQQEAELAMLKKQGIDDPDSVGPAGYLVHVVPEIYNHVSTTPLKQTIEAKSGQTLTFDLTTKQK
jgi:hypothetical protein